MNIRTAAILATMAIVTIPAQAAAYTIGPPSSGTTEALEKQARESAEAQERENKERAAREQAAREQTNQPAPAPAPAAPPATPETSEATPKATKTVYCVVPSLAGESLAGARKRLAKAHCKLGKVTTSRKGHGALVVTTQTPGHGKKLPEGTAVAVRVGHSSR